MLKQNITILGQEIEKGTSCILEFEIAKLHTRNKLNMPIIIERAKQNGPVLLLIGGVHGDETNGVAIVRDIIRKGYNKPKRGTVICIPVFNVFGFVNHQRAFPDGRDLNRMFPGSKSGSLASQFAYQFTKEIAPIADYVIDFHTGGATRSNYPNVRCVMNQSESLELAKAFGAPYIVNSDYIPKSVRATFNKMGKKILLYEGGKALEIDTSVVNCGVEGALNVMKYLKMQSGRIKTNHKPIIINKSKWLRSPHSGLFQPLVKNGSKVEYKSKIARIFDPYGEFEKTILAPNNCYIFGMNTSPTINKGDAIFHISIDDN